jgi:hypothetical protein
MAATTHLFEPEPGNRGTDVRATRSPPRTAPIGNTGIFETTTGDDLPVGARLFDGVVRTTTWDK